MRLNVLHAIHDYLPRHRAGSEIYASTLCRALQAWHHVTVLCAEYDPTAVHGEVRWRLHDGVPVAEVVNSWAESDFASTYQSPVISERIGQLLDAIQPDVLHVHSLINLSLTVPALAHARRIPVVATLHDYTLVCPSGGQRVHRAEQHVCHEIETDRCARCFPDSPFHAQWLLGRHAGTGGRGALTRQLALALRRRWPTFAERGAGLARRLAPARVTGLDIERRMEAARAAIDHIDLFVAPVPATARELERLGVPPERLRVSDYGIAPVPPTPRRGDGDGPLEIGFVGSLVWHKGVHVLLDAVRSLPAGTWRLTIHGDTTTFPAYVEALRKAATGLPVTFAGSFDRDRTAEVYGGLDVVVVPSLWLENSPLVIHEALACGVPVVGARIGGIPDLVEEGRHGVLYDPETPSELSVALERLATDRGALRALQASARRAPKSIADDARFWSDVYAELAARPAE